MTEDELIARGDANYFDSMRIFAPRLDGGEARERDGLLIAATGLPLAFLNIAFITRPLGEPETLVREAISYFDRRGLPFILRIREGLDEASERAAEEAGLAHHDTVPGMVLFPLSEADTETPPLEVRRVEDAAILTQYADVLAQGFGMPVELGRRFASPGLLDAMGCSLFLGFAEGRPVTTSALVATHRVAGVYNVATLEVFRGRGFGEAMTRHAIAAGAAAGCVMASLQSSQMGYRVYERIGFRTVAPYRTFVRPEAQDAEEV